jgi:hypothetical protein
LADAWQGRGLGTLLTSACLRIADDWGCDWVRAETSVDNVRMLNLLKAHEFSLEHRDSHDTVFGRKQLNSAQRSVPRRAIPSHRSDRIHSLRWWKNAHVGCCLQHLVKATYGEL